MKKILSVILRVFKNPEDLYATISLPNTNLLNKDYGEEKSEENHATTKKKIRTPSKKELNNINGEL